MWSHLSIHLGEEEPVVFLQVDNDIYNDTGTIQQGLLSIGDTSQWTRQTLLQMCGRTYVDTLPQCLLDMTES